MPTSDNRVYKTNNMVGLEYILFYIFFGACFLCFIMRTSYHVLQNRGSTLTEGKRLQKLVMIVMFFLFSSWFYMLLGDPYGMNLPSSARYAGLVLSLIGVFFFAISHLGIKGLESDELVTRGIYSKIRHPMYLGFILWLVGLPLFIESLFTLASAVIWIPHILYWRLSEERQLARKYEGYREYKEKTWF